MFHSISTADGFEQMTVMCPERVVSPIVELVTASTLKNASRFARIIRVEKVSLMIRFQTLFVTIYRHPISFCLLTAPYSWTWNGKTDSLERTCEYKSCC